MKGVAAPPQPPWIDSLRRILALEREKGFADRAVMGGLDRYLRRWAGEAVGGVSQPGMLRRFQELHLAAPGYAGWSREERERWVAQVLAFLDEVENTGTVLKGLHSKGKPAASPPRPSTPRRRRAVIAPAGLGLDSPLSHLPEVSSAIAAKLTRLGVNTLRDMLYFFPRRHLDYSQHKSINQLEVGQEQTVIALVWEARQTSLGGRPGTEAVLGDETGNVRAVWFNQPYIARRLPTNARLVLSGRVSLFQGRKQFESPEWELLEEGELIHTGRLVPVYPLTEGLYPRQVRRIAKQVVDGYASRLADFLPPDILGACALPGLAQAIQQAHFPDSIELKAVAERRLAFDELFLLQIGILSRKRQWQEEQPGPAFSFSGEVAERFVGSLPFALTPAQERALGEILTDLSRPRAMSRLLQGEVGSGKTVVATAALLTAAASGYQGALMAPTEILAEQHFLTLNSLLSRVGGGGEGNDVLRCYPTLLPRPLTLSLLTGSLRLQEKDNLRHLIARGEVDILIGTHALIQREVEFHRLGLVVVDEQHRFGVLQRSALRQKGYNPHMLVMTATPIPRSLALTLYGDLELSVIDQLPPGRQQVRTRWLSPQKRDTAYEFLRRQVAEGRQGFIICPLIEESESLEVKAAVAEYQRLSEQVFPELRLGLLHGRMPPPEKETAMRRFRAGELDILVSTPVVEVGIDVPNATVMLVEGAERFGLSQLHQFRGRVGRGDKPSYCILVAENPSAEAVKRLEVVVREHDGFALAEEDLRLRGPGEFFGTRQSGLPDLRMARLTDIPLMELARGQAQRLLEQDRELGQREHRWLTEELQRRWPERGEWS